MRSQFVGTSILFFGVLLASILASTLVVAPVAHSQTVDETQDLHISGTVDVYYQKNFNGQSTSSGRIFDANNNVIQLQWAEASLRKTVSPLDVQVDFAFGEMADLLASANDPTKNIPQAFFIYSPTALPELSVQGGKFYTWVGYETVRPMDNWNVSRSLTYNYGTPFWHQGLLSSYRVLPELLTAGFAIVNGWNGPIAQEQNKSQTFGGYLETKWIYGLKLRYNLISGIESPDKHQVRQVHNLIGSYYVSDQLAVAFDFTYGRQSDTPSGAELIDATWLGWALYGQMVPVKPFTLALRYEVFDDRNGLPLNLFASADPLKAQKITSVTATLGYQFDASFEGRLEYRADKSNRTGFYVSDDGSPGDFENTLAVEAFAKF